MLNEPIKLQSKHFRFCMIFFPGYDEDGFRLKQGGGGGQVHEGDGLRRGREGLVRRVHGKVEDLVIMNM
jgi:hypothetical protein